jgi:hypothetical protein
MQEPYDQGLANQIGPAPCVGVREGVGEASERGSVSWVSSRESNLRDADPVGKWGRQHGTGRLGEPCGRSRVVIDPMRAWTLLVREPGELSLDRRALPVGPCRGGR